jgi:hypothetical protein
MENRKVYFVKYNYENKEIIDENFDAVMTQLIYSNDPFEVCFLNEYNIADSAINSIINKYISDCKKPGEVRNFAVGFNIDLKRYNEFPSYVRRLLKGLITYYEDFHYLRNSDDYYLFDVFLKYSGFKVLIPKKLVSEEEYNKFLYMGPDYLFGCFLFTDQIFEYIIPGYYKFLFENDLFDDQSYEKLSSYHIGLA